MTPWLLILFVTAVIIGRELLASRVNEDANWDEAPEYQKEYIRNQDIPAELWWVIASRYHNSGYEMKRRVYFAGNPDCALNRWLHDEGDGWKIEVVTQDPDRADKIMGLETP